MTRFALLIFVVLVANVRGNVVDIAPARGRSVAAINWIDETGRTRSLGDLAGYPVVLLPIYTRCPGPCIQNVDRLKETLANSASDPRQFRVLLFSFDATDNVGTLLKYRQRENIPLGWSIGTASQPDIDALLESIGVQVGKAGKEFVHPNIVIVLDSKLRVAKWIYGTNYSGADVDLALKVAGGGNDWLGEHSQLLYSLLLFAGSLLCVALCYLLAQLKSSRGLTRIDGTVRAVAVED
ncbi:MAG TPA: SCO family protein [Chthoniobacterales bacterium]|nr:SCO family protein [Chthoniobacterales bacterium]